MKLGTNHRLSGRGKRAIVVAASLTVVTIPASILAQAPPAESAQEHSQLARSRGGEKRFYPENKFDLSRLESYKPAAQLSGTLRVAGSNYITDSPLAGWWRDAFRKFHPNLEIEYNTPSAAIAIPSLYLGAADIGMNHEPSFYDYLSFMRLKGYAPTGFSIVTGSFNLSGWQNTIVIAVHKSNPINSLSMEQLDGIFGSRRDGGWAGAIWHPEFTRGSEKDIRTWGQLGVKGALANKRIHVYGYTPRYATALEFSNKVLQSSDKWNEDLVAFGNARQADNSISSQADQMRDAMIQDPSGIAIIRYKDEVPRDLKVLAIAPLGGGAPVPYTIETIQNRTYPLWGDQSFFVSVKPGTKLDPKIKEFIRFVLSREGQELVRKDGKYLPLSLEVSAEELRKLAAY